MTWHLITDGLPSDEGNYWRGVGKQTEIVGNKSADFFIRHAGTQITSELWKDFKKEVLGE